MNNINFSIEDVLPLYMSLEYFLDALDQGMQEVPDPEGLADTKKTYDKVSKTFDKLKQYCSDNDITID